jgi:hypothetical protein
MLAARSRLVRLAPTPTRFGRLAFAHQVSHGKADAQPHYHSDENTGYLFGLKVKKKKTLSDECGTDTESTRRRPRRCRVGVVSRGNEFICPRVVSFLSRSFICAARHTEGREVSEGGMGDDLLLWFLGLSHIHRHRLQSAARYEVSEHRRERPEDSSLWPHRGRVADEEADARGVPDRLDVMSECCLFVV